MQEYCNTLELITLCSLYLVCKLGKRETIIIFKTQSWSFRRILISTPWNSTTISHSQHWTHNGSSREKEQRDTKIVECKFEKKRVWIKFKRFHYTSHVSKQNSSPFSWHHWFWNVASEKRKFAWLILFLSLSLLFLSLFTNMWMYWFIWVLYLCFYW